MPRLTHQSSAQLITTGTIISSCNGLHPQRYRQTGAASPYAIATDLRTGPQYPRPDETKTVISQALLGSSTVIGAPVWTYACTTRFARAAKPRSRVHPSRVAQGGVRASRLLVRAAISFAPVRIAPKWLPVLRAECALVMRVARLVRQVGSTCRAMSRPPTPGDFRNR